MEIWILILVSFFVTNSLDKAESVQLEETPLNPLDEIFGEGWWDIDKDEEWNKLTLEQNSLHQIERQNTQIGQIEPNSTDQNPPFTESDHSGQIEPNSTDQNRPLTKSDHSGQIEPNSTDQNRPLTESDLFGQIEPNSTDQNRPLTESDHNGQIEPNSTDQNRPLTESDLFGQIEPCSTDQNRPLTESDHNGQIEPNSTDQNPPITESDHSDNAKIGKEQNEIMKKTSNDEDEHKPTIYAWKRKLGQTKPQHNHNEQKKLMKLYYEIKDKNPKISDNPFFGAPSNPVAIKRTAKKLSRSI
uniref:Uncharacterized protein n=1 Tax=Globodera rostochiensis TaxID=31243 RepID=A0A914HPG6_GLORO